MKHLIILSLVSIVSINTFSQKVAKVTVSTTDSISTSIQKCTDAGREMKYGKKDLDLSAGKVTLWRTVSSLSGSSYEFQILIIAEIKDGKTLFTFRMPHTLAIISYTKELKKLVEKLKLSDMVVGEYFDGIE